jgi:hypothetical protein
MLLKCRKYSLLYEVRSITVPARNQIKTNIGIFENTLMQIITRIRSRIWILSITEEYLKVRLHLRGISTPTHPKVKYVCTRYTYGIAASARYSIGYLVHLPIKGTSTPTRSCPLRLQCEVQLQHRDTVQPPHVRDTSMPTYDEVQLHLYINTRYRTVDLRTHYKYDLRRYENMTPASIKVI